MSTSPFSTPKSTEMLPALNELVNELPTTMAKGLETLPGMPDLGILRDLMAQQDPALFNRALARSLAGLPSRPVEVARSVARFGGAMSRVAMRTAGRVVGDRTPNPRPKDKRFADPAFDGNSFFYGVRETWEETGAFLQALIAIADVDEVTRRKAAFAADYITQMMAPTNFLPLNPTALKRAFDTGGLSVAKGLANFVDDLIHNEGGPKQVDTSPFTLGENIACTPGEVVYRNDLMELIQYAPQTDEVHEVPLLLSPPWINKYYVMDLAPGRSFAEWAVQHGHTVFVISYRQPDEDMAGTTMDDYLLHGPLRAIDVIAEITGEEKIDIVGLCLGGALTAMLVAYLEQEQPDRVNTVTLLNTLLDFSEPGVLGNYTDPDTVAALEKRMSSKGYLTGGAMAETFDSLRPNDLIFNYVANRWLMGEQPPAFDILAWNDDATRMPADMHSFYLRACYIENRFSLGELELAGRLLSPKDISCPVYVVAAENDHIVPWTSSYKTTQLASGKVEFVLSSAGHIAGIVNPPGPKARLWTNSDHPSDPQRWRAGAEEHAMSWWVHWADWAKDVSGDMVPARSPGSKAFPGLGAAPGQYVMSEGR